MKVFLMVAILLPFTSAGGWDKKIALANKQETEQIPFKFKTHVLKVETTESQQFVGIKGIGGEKPLDLKIQLKNDNTGYFALNQCTKAGVQGDVNTLKNIPNTGEPKRYWRIIFREDTLDIDVKTGNGDWKKNQWQTAASMTFKEISNKCFERNKGWQEIENIKLISRANKINVNLRYRTDQSISGWKKTKA